MALEGPALGGSNSEFPLKQYNLQIPLMVWQMKAIKGRKLEARSALGSHVTVSMSWFKAILIFCLFILMSSQS